MRWGKEKEYSPTFSGPISSSVKSEVKVIQSLKMLPCLTFHDPDLLTSLLNVVKEEYVLTTPLAFLASEHFFSLLRVTLRDDFSVIEVDLYGTLASLPSIYVPTSLFWILQFLTRPSAQKLRKLE